MLAKNKENCFLTETRANHVIANFLLAKILTVESNGLEYTSECHLRSYRVWCFDINIRSEWWCKLSKDKTRHKDIVACIVGNQKTSRIKGDQSLSGATFQTLWKLSNTSEQ